MNSVEVIVQEALGAWLEAQIEEERSRAICVAAREEGLEKERAEVREWLATQIPEALVKYVDLSDYSHQDAGSRLSSPHDDGYGGGVGVHLVVPGADPVFFVIERSHKGQFSFGKKRYDYTGNLFSAPTYARVRADENGEPYIQWEWPPHHNYADIQLALGHAAAFQQANRQRLEEEWDALLEKSAKPAVPQEEPRLTLEERKVLALEAIADALSTMSYNAM
jgi:hypothetical protein